MKNYLSVFLLVLFVSKPLAQGGSTCSDFGGTSEYIDLGNNFKYTSALTIEMWAWHSTWQPASKQTLISNYSAGGYRIRLDSDSRIKFYTNNGTEHKITFSTSSLSSGWHHIACTYDNTSYKLCIDGDEKTSGGDYTIRYDADNYTLIGAEAGGGSTPSNEFFDGYIDEVKIWNRVLSETEINEWMNKPITSSSNPSYISNLQGYYKYDTDWVNGWLDDASGDVGGANDIDATNHSVTTTSSTAPIGDLTSGYSTDAEALWRANGTNNSEASNGLWMSVGTALINGNFVVFGNNNTDGKSFDDLPTGPNERTARIWYIDESGTVSANLTFDISDATGHTKIADAASSYKLLYRSGTSGDFSIDVDGANSVSDDQVTFNSVSLQDGYYAMGAATGGLPVLLSSFTACYENDSVVLQWTTESLAGGVGFILERRKTQTTDWQQIASYLTDSTLVCMNNPVGYALYTFIDNKADPNATYFYRLSDADIFGNITVLVVIEISITGIFEMSSGALPEKTKLTATYPNPFNPQTKIIYQLAEDAVVDLLVYNILGQKVRQLQAGVKLSAGEHNIYWNGKDDAGKMNLSGTYFIVFKAGNYIESEKVLLLR